MKIPHEINSFFSKKFLVTTPTWCSQLFWKWHSSWPDLPTYCNMTLLPFRQDWEVIKQFFGWNFNPQQTVWHGLSLTFVLELQFHKKHIKLMQGPNEMENVSNLRSVTGYFHYPMSNLRPGAFPQLRLPSKLRKKQKMTQMDIHILGL